MKCSNINEKVTDKSQLRLVDHKTPRKRQKSRPYDTSAVSPASCKIIESEFSSCSVINISEVSNKVYLLCQFV